MNVIKRMITLIVLFSLIGGLYGCTNQSPSDSVKVYLEQIKKGDTEGLKTLVSESLNENQITIGDLNSYESTQKLLAIMKTMTYTINSEKIQGESATVNVTINAPDLAAVVGEVIEKIISNKFSVVLSGDGQTQEEMNKLIDTLVVESLEHVKNTERTGDISLVQKDGQWEIKPDESLIKLLTNLDKSLFK